MNKNFAEAVEIQQGELTAQNLPCLGSEGVRAKGVKIQLLETCEYGNTSAFKRFSLVVYRNLTEINFVLYLHDKVSLIILETQE